MSVNNIDTIIDKTIDNFFEVYIKNESFFEKIYKDKENFLKYEKNITEIVESFLNSLNITEIDDIITNEEKKKYIIDIIKKYVLIYIFLFIASQYTNEKKIFINNILEYGRHSSENKTLNITVVSKITSLYQLIKDVIYLSSLTSAQLKTLNKSAYLESYNFLNNLGEEYVKTFFQINDKNISIHNLLKTVIYRTIYEENDKLNIMKLLDDIEKIKGEYIYIDTVYAKEITITFEELEKIFGYRANDVKELLENKIDVVPTEEEKINALFSSSFIIPITDEFLIFHDNRYSSSEIKFSEDCKDNKDQDCNKKFGKKKNEQKKIQVILNKIDSSTEYYTKKDEQVNMFFSKKKERKAILNNELEELNIIDKLIYYDKFNVSKNELYMSLLEYRVYPYINFKDFSSTGFSYISPDNIYNENNKYLYGLRKNNIENNVLLKKKIIEYRSIIPETVIHIHGICVKDSQTENECYRVKSLMNIIDIKWEFFNDKQILEIINPDNIELKENNGEMKMLYYLLLLFFKIKNPYKNKIVYWLFENDYPNKKEYPEMKIILGHLYNVLSDFILNSLRIKNKENVLDVIKYINNNIIDLTKHDEYEVIIENIKKNSYEIVSDKKEFSINIKNKIKKKEYLKKTEKKNSELIPIEAINYYNLSEYKPSSFYTNLPYVPYIFTGKIPIKENKTIQCHHIISLQNIRKIPKSNVDDMNVALNKFIEKFLLYSKNGDYVCKSCNQYVYLGYNVSSSHNQADDNFTVFYTPLNVDLLTIDKYKHLPKVINRLGIILDKLILISGKSIDNLIKNSIIQNTIDIIEWQFNNGTEKKYNSGFRIFKLLDILLGELTDIEQMLSYNNMIIYLSLIFITTLNSVNISRLNTDKYVNLINYKKVENVLFGDKIINNVDISEYPVLCYVLYIFSYFLIRYKLLFLNSENSHLITNQKTIINIFIDMINSILNTSDSNNYIHRYIINQLNSMLLLAKNKNILETIQSQHNKKISMKENKIKTTYQLKFEYDKDNKNIEYPIVNRNYGIILSQNKSVRNPFTLLYDRPNKITTCSMGPRIGSFHKFDKNNVCIYCKEQIKKEKNNEIDVETINNSKKYMNQEKFNSFCEEDPENELCTLTVEKFIEFKNNKKEVKRREEQTKLELDKMVEDEIEEKNKVLYKDIIKTKINTIDDLINIFEKYIGKNINIGSAESPIYLNENTYIIDHNYTGDKKVPPLIITEKSGKIEFKKDHVFYKKDVLFYKDVKINTTIFYDLNTMKLIGFKKDGQDFSLINSKKIMIINYSFRHKFLNIEDIQKFAFFFMQSINKINYYQNIKDQYVKSYHKNVLQDIIKKYYEELKEFNIQDIFKNWDYIRKYSESDEDIYKYLISELINLIIINKYPEKIIYLILDLVNYKFVDKNLESKILELNRFKMILNANEETLDGDLRIKKLEDDTDDGEVVGIYQEFMTNKELNSEEYIQEAKEDIERKEAMDVDADIDNPDDDVDGDETNEYMEGANADD